jgi:HAMP domain-containing protein
MKLSQKFGALSALSAAIPSFLILAIALYTLSSSANQRVTEQLKQDSRVALGLYEKRLDGLRAVATQLAVDVANKALVSSDNQATDAQQAWARLQDLLPRAQNDFNLDFVIVADPTGRVIARHNERPSAGETLGDASNKNPIAEKVISDGIQLRNSTLASIVVESSDRLAKLGLEQLARVFAVGAPDKVKVSDALIIEAGAPIFSNGRFVGMVLLGQMLNNYYAAKPGADDLQTPLIAEIRQTLQLNNDNGRGAVVVYPRTVIASSLTTSTGYVNTPLLVGQDVVSLQADEVKDDRGRRYAIALQPIKSLDNSPIAAVGVVSSLDDIAGSSTGLKFTLIAIGLLATLLSGLAGYILGGNLASRVNTMTEAANRMSVGELSAPVRDEAVINKPKLPEFLLNDEVNTLANHLEEMRESFRQAIERLRKR